MFENILDYLRMALYAALIGLCFLLFQAWDKDHPAKSAEAEQAAAVQRSGTSYVPPVNEVSQTGTQPAVARSCRTAVPGLRGLSRGDLGRAHFIRTRGVPADRAGPSR